MTAPWNERPDLGSLRRGLRSKIAAQTTGDTRPAADTLARTIRRLATRATLSSPDAKVTDKVQNWATYIAGPPAQEAATVLALAAVAGGPGVNAAALLLSGELMSARAALALTGLPAAGGASGVPLQPGRGF